MIKRITAVVLILVLLVTAVSCGEKNVANSNNIVPDPTPNTSENVNNTVPDLTSNTSENTNNTAPDPTPAVSADKMAIIDRNGSLLGEIDSRAFCMAADNGIFYSIFELGMNQFTADAEYHFLNMESKQDTLLGVLENQSYEAFYTRTEYNNRIYTLAAVGSLASDQPVQLVLLAFDPAAEMMKKYTVTENGFPYASMDAVNGKLLIMSHEMADPKCDRIYEFDPATETIKEVLTFSSDSDSLRGISSAESGFYLLRLKIKNGGENEMFLDKYDNNYSKVSEQSVNETMIKATMEIPGMLERQDALNELGQYANSFTVKNDRYLIYSNFSMTRLLIDLKTDEAVLIENDIYSVSIGSGDPFFYRTDYDAENVEEPDITGIVDGKLVKLDFTPADTHKLIRDISHSSAGNWLVRTSDVYSAQDSTYVLHFWAEP